MCYAFALIRRKAPFLSREETISAEEEVTHPKSCSFVPEEKRKLAICTCEGQQPKKDTLLTSRGGLDPESCVTLLATYTMKGGYPFDTG
eukprot:scaffold3058_cov177-Amphora_coffeaeformis.AAC.9